MLIWAKFDSFFYYVSNMGSLLQKIHFPIEVALNSLRTQKGLELVFRPQFLYNFFIKVFLF